MDNPSLLKPDTLQHPHVLIITAILIGDDGSGIVLHLEGPWMVEGYMAETAQAFPQNHHHPHTSETHKHDEDVSFFSSWMQHLVLRSALSPHIKVLFSCHKLYTVCIYKTPTDLFLYNFM